MRKLICKLRGHKKPYFRGLTAVGPAMFCRRCRLSVYLCDDWWKGRLMDLPDVPKESAL